MTFRGKWSFLGFYILCHDVTCVKKWGKAALTGKLDFRQLFSKIWCGNFSLFIIHYFHSNHSFVQVDLRKNWWNRIKANGTKRVVIRPKPASFCPATSTSHFFFVFFRASFRFFKKFHEISWNITNLQSQEVSQSSHSPIVSIRHVLNHFILLL